MAVSRRSTRSTFSASLQGLGYDQSARAFSKDQRACNRRAHPMTGLGQEERFARAEAERPVSTSKPVVCQVRLLGRSPIDLHRRLDWRLLQPVRPDESGICATGSAPQVLAGKIYALPIVGEHAHGGDVPFAPTLH